MATKINMPNLKGVMLLDETFDAVVSATFEQEGKLARDITRAARRNAQEVRDSGELARGIHHRVLTRNVKEQKFAFGNSSAIQKFHRVVSDAPHSAAVEYGTKERFRKSGGSTGIMPKIGVIWPAYDEVAPGFAASMRGVHLRIRGR